MKKIRTMEISMKRARVLLLALVAFYVTTIIIESSSANNPPSIWSYSRDFIALFTAIYAAIKAAYPTILLHVYSLSAALDMENQPTPDHRLRIITQGSSSDIQVELECLKVENVKIISRYNNEEKIDQQAAISFDPVTRNEVLAISSFPTNIPLYVHLYETDIGVYDVTGQIQLLVRFHSFGVEKNDKLLFNFQTTITIE